MAGLSGPQLQDRLAELGYRLPIVFISGHGDIPTTVQTIKAGAEDFLTKPVETEKLLAAIGRALVRYQDMREQEDQIAVLRMRLSRLTPREREVMAMLVRGKLHKQIAHELRSTVRTVEWHRHNLMQKVRSALAGRTGGYRRSPWAVVGGRPEGRRPSAGRDQALVLKLR